MGYVGRSKYLWEVGVGGWGEVGEGEGAKWNSSTNDPGCCRLLMTFQGEVN